MSAVDLYLMSPPAPSFQLRGRANFRSEAAAPVDARLAIKEWVSLADAIVARGGRVVCLVPDRDTELTGLPYAAECGHLVEQDGELCFLLPNMAVPHRVRERELWRQVAKDLGWTPVDLPTGIWEAQGDIAWFRGRTLLFFGGRTDRAGVLAAAPFFPKDALLVEIGAPAFHGNMAALPLEAADRMLVCRDVIAPSSLSALEESFGEDALTDVSVEEVRRYATNGLPIGKSVLAPHLVPAPVVGLMESWGLEVVSLSMTELCEKAGGASRCLVSRARVEQRRVTIPPHLDYTLLRDGILADV